MPKLLIHPLLFAFFPIIFLYCNNWGHLSTEQVYVPVFVSTMLSIATWLIFQFKYQNKYKSALATSLFLILFYSYGHIFEILPTEPIRLRQHWVFLPIWSGLLYVGVRTITRNSLDLHQINTGANIAALALILIPFLSNFFLFSKSFAFSDEANASFLTKIQTEHLPTPERRPDIYYIVLDAYARADTLRDIFNYDNTPFLHFLKEKGFSIAEQSRANYNQTWLALSSCLNLTYLNGFAGDHGMEEDNRKPLKQLIQNNQVVPFLKHYGYQFVSFESGQSFTNMKAADISLPARKEVNEFHVTFLSTTPLPGLFYEMGRIFGDPKNAYQVHRDRINYTFDHLPDFAGKESPVFVFAHILGPHPPFVFGPNGEPIDPDRRYWIGDGTAFFNKGGTMEEYLKNYAGEVEYLNKRLQHTIEQILKNSTDPPIIILQSDHGSRLELDWLDENNTNFQEAFSILSAFYLPDTAAQVPQGISPVNTFRFILNTYFGTNHELLEDRSFYSRWDQPYNFKDVTDEIT